VLNGDLVAAVERRDEIDRIAVLPRGVADLAIGVQHSPQAFRGAAAA